MDHPQNMSLVFKALEFAARKHRDQRRKDQAASPYINHPIALSHLLWNVAQIEDPVVIAGALLHDTVEDTATTFTEIEQEFGSDVHRVVREVTDNKSLPKQTRKQLQIDHAAHLSQQAKLIKLADKIANLQDLTASPPHHWSRQRQREYFTWAKQVIDQMRGTHPQLEALFDEVYRAGLERLS